MRDAFLGTMLGIAVILVAAYAVLVVKTLTSKSDGGCMLFVVGWTVFLIVAAILVAVGHAVGVDMSGLSGW